MDSGGDQRELGERPEQRGVGFVHVFAVREALLSDHVHELGLGDDHTLAGVRDRRRRGEGMVLSVDGESFAGIAEALGSDGVYLAADHVR